jgi:hypothetical protein
MADRAPDLSPKVGNKSMFFRAIALSSEAKTGSREENASKQKIRALVLIQSEPKWLWR